MIPVELKLSNFMSYGSDVSPLSFKSFHLACLTGDNGNGKSALIDAITWAVWGQARGVDKNGSGMDDLVKLGQEHMEVEFTFELEGDIYRIIRKRDKRRGISILELQIQDQDRFRVISGDKIADTQKQVVQVLKMDYETFTNSALVLQGKADTFTQQKPNDRKRILGEILGLGFYDELERKAREKGRDFEQEAKMLTQQILLLKEETQAKSEICLQLEEIEKKESEIQEKIKVDQETYNNLIHQKQEYDNALVKIDQLEQRLISDKGEVTKYKTLINAIMMKIHDANKLLERESEIVQGYQEHIGQLELKDALERKQIEFFELTTRINKFRSTIDEKKRLAYVKLENIQQEINELKGIISVKGAKEKESSRLELELKELESVQLRKEASELNLQSFATEIAVQKAKIPDLKMKLEELKQNYLTLKKAPKCPLCSNDLESNNSKQRVLELVANEGKELKSKISEIELSISDFNTLIVKNKQEIEGYTQLIHGQKSKEKELTLIEKELSLIAEAEIKLRNRLEQHNILQSQLDNKEYAQPEYEEIILLTNSLGQLNFDKDVYEKLIKTVENTKVYIDQMNKLTVVKDTLQQHQQNLDLYSENMARKIKQIEEDQEICSLLQKRISELKESLVSIELVEEQIMAEKKQLSRIEQQKGALNERMQRCLKLELEQHQKEQKWRESLKEKNYYNELTQAFGKKGIQAIIIENAIPELQDEANKLLNRMTDGRLNVALVTQKGNKKGAVVETLDIQISDELGTRKYEMYSGGEAFRVNFALRIALSKLLAKRAGARLQTLIIDEGFGTQDGRGKERLIELITTIQDDFAKILVITHIPELKEAFPVHLEVKKDHEGSMVTII